MMSNADALADAQIAYAAWVRNPNREPVAFEVLGTEVVYGFVQGYLSAADRLVEAEKALREIADMSPHDLHLAPVRIARAYFASHDLPKGDVK